MVSPTYTRSSVCCLLCILLCFCYGQVEPPAGTAPAARPDAESGSTLSVLPGGRFIEPAGRRYSVGPAPRGFAVGPYAHFLVSADGGPLPFTLSVLTEGEVAFRYDTTHTAGAGSKQYAANEPWQSGYSAVGFAGRSTLYASEGNSGRVRLLRLPWGRVEATIELNAGGYQDSYSGALLYDGRRKVLYVADEANSRVVLIDTRTQRVVSSVTTGLLPVALTAAPSGERIYVAAAGSHSLSVIDVRDSERPRVLAVIPTGSEAAKVGGSSPSSVAASADRIYVANAHSDSISVIDAHSLRRLGEIGLRIPSFEHLRGIVPTGIALHKPSGWLFASEAGINAVAVIDPKTARVMGHVPAGRSPIDITIQDDVVYVLSHDDSGASANRRFGRTDPYQTALRGRIDIFGVNLPRPSSVFGAPQGTWDDPAISSGAPAPRPDAYVQALREMTKRVYALNGFRGPAKALPKLPEVRHVVMLIRENCSFDEVLGDITSAGGRVVRSSPDLARFGISGRATPRAQGEFGQRNVRVTPNLHAIASRWTFADNFYSDAQFDADGHLWLSGAYPNAWTLRSLAANFAGEKDNRAQSSAPGRRRFQGTARAMLPEQYPEAGTMWHHLVRHGISLRNYGLGLDLPGAVPDSASPLGLRLPDGILPPAPLWKNSCQSYPGFNPEVPDQTRADILIDDLRSRRRRGEPLPRVTVAYLPAAREMVPRPPKYPFDASYVADNDYAIGRIVEYLSHTPEWRQMLVIILDDDATNGVDHVHRQRVPLLMAGPHVRRGYVTQVNANIPAIWKLLLRLLGVPPLNLFDATAANLGEVLTPQPELTPFEAHAPDARVFAVSVAP